METPILNDDRSFPPISGSPQDIDDACNTTITDDSRGSICLSARSYSFNSIHQIPDAFFLPSFCYHVFDCTNCDEFMQQIQQRITDLDKACNLLFDVLLLYVKTCLSTHSITAASTSSSQSRNKGLKLPASAMGWLSSYINNSNNQPLSSRLLKQTETRYTSLPQLKGWLSKYVTHLHVNGKELWPRMNPIEPSENLDSSLPSSKPTLSEIRIQPTTQSMKHETIVSNQDVLFMYHYHYLQYYPSLDFHLFPKLSVLILDGVPLPWIANLHVLKNTLNVLKIINTCIYDIQHFFHTSNVSKQDESSFSSSIQDEGLLFHSLEHITISNCALGELSKLRGHDRCRPFMNSFPNLKNMDLSHNEIRSKDTALAGLSDLLQLSSIDLSYNYITRYDYRYRLVSSLV